MSFFDNNTPLGKEVIRRYIFVEIFVEIYIQNKESDNFFFKHVKYSYIKNNIFLVIFQANFSLKRDNIRSALLLAMANVHVLTLWEVT